MVKSAVSLIILASVIAGMVYIGNRHQPTKLAASGLKKTATDIKWTGCDGKDQSATITGVIVTGTFMANTVININMAGVFKQNCNLNDIDVNIKLGFITVFEEDIEYKLDAKAGQPFNETFGSQIYIDAPSGGYRATLRFRDPSTEVLQCTLVTFKLS